MIVLGSSLLVALVINPALIAVLMKTEQPVPIEKSLVYFVVLGLLELYAI